MYDELCMQDITLQVPCAIPDKQYLLVAGGRQPAEEWLGEMAHNKTLWAIDRGLDSYKKINLLPHQLIGDGDSAQQASWIWAAEHNVPIANFPVKKDFTDTQLALDMLKDEDAFIILTGALGGRFDHAFSTIFSFAHSGLKGCIADEQEAIFFLRGDDSCTLKFKHKNPKAISLLPMTEVVKNVSIDGVYWPLEQTDLYQNYPYAISNETISDSIHISTLQGILAIYICWKE